MAKSKRHRAAREASATAVATSARPPKVGGLNKNDWKKLENTLPCLLSVEIQSPSTAADADLLCPRVAWLVMHLDRVIAPPPTSSRKSKSSLSFLANLGAAVDAVATLCDEAERLRERETLYNEFWTRLMHSDIMEAPPAELESWLIYVKEHGTPVLFSWRGKKLEAWPVMEVVSQFLARPTQGKRNSVAGLRFEECRLTARDIVMIHALVKRPEAVSKGPDHRISSLVDVGLLSVSCNPLDVDALTALADLLEDPATATISELRLDGIMQTGHDCFMTPAYLAAFQRILSPPSASAKDHRSTAVSLTLTRHVSVDDEHLRALCEALVVATRPLRSLTVANIRPNGQHAWLHLGKLLLTRIPNAEPDCELRFSWIDNAANLWSASDALYMALEHLVVDAVAQLRDDRIVIGSPVSCRLMNQIMFYDQQLTERRGSNRTLRELTRIQEISPEGRLRVSTPDGAGSGWVSSASIAKLQVGDCVIVGSSFSSLVFDIKGNEFRGYSTEGFLRDFLWVLGANLKKLEFVNSSPVITPQLPALLRGCPILEELTIEKMTVDPETLNWLVSLSEFQSSLEVLKVGGCDLDEAAVDRFREFKTLRYLSIERNAIGQKGLQSLLQWLRDSELLQYVAVSTQPADEHGDASSLRVAIDHRVRYEYVSTETKIAFLSVAAAQRAEGHLTAEAIAQIFQFAGERRRRLIKWCYCAAHHH